MEFSVHTNDYVNLDNKKNKASVVIVEQDNE